MVGGKLTNKNVVRVRCYLQINRWVSVRVSVKNYSGARSSVAVDNKEVTRDVRMTHAQRAAGGIIIRAVNVRVALYKNFKVEGKDSMTRYWEYYDFTILRLRDIIA